MLLLFPLGTLFVCKVFLERERQIETEKKLFASEESYRTTLMSIGDAVISTDATGRIALLNNVAENLTGWSQEEAVGLPLDNVFRIISETSRQEVENPASRVIREGIVVGLANHTLLIARDGTERPIADSAAPIWDSLGCLTGVVLVFRGQTAEREAEEKVTKSERLLSDLMSHLPGMVYRCKNDAGCPSDFISDGCLELTGHPPEVVRHSSHSDQIALLVYPEDQARIREETERAVREDRPYLLNYRLQTAAGEIKWVEERGRALVEQGASAPHGVFIWPGAW